MQHDSFADLVEREIAARGISASRLGREALGDPGFVAGLRAGRSPTLRTVGRVMQFLRDISPTSQQPQQGE